MKHDRLMKYPKRFCVECSAEQYVHLQERGSIQLYYCQVCGGEVCRVGDGPTKESPRRVVGGLDVNSFSGDFLGGKSSEVLACEYPDVLSDEHSLWPARDFELEAERDDYLRTFKLALSNLTARQVQVLEAVEQYGTHERAATHLRVKRNTITTVIKQIRKKITKYVNKTGEGEKQGKGTI